MHNPVLFNALKAYFLAACELLRPRLPDFPATKLQLISDKGPSAGMKFTMAYDWHFWFGGSNDGLNTLPEYQAALKALRQDEALIALLASLESRLAHERILLDLFKTQVIRQDGFDFDPQVFKRLYQELSEDFHSTIIIQRLFAPLRNFKMESERLDIEPGLSIVRMTLQELNLVINRPGLNYSPRAEFAVEVISVDSKRKFSEEGGSSLETEKIFDLLNVLRLFQSGQVNMDTYWLTAPKWSILNFQTIYMDLPQLGAFTLHKDDYILKEKHQEDLLKLWHNYQNKTRTTPKANRPIKLACERFSSLHGHRKPQERLLDLLNVPEPLLRKGPEDSDELFRRRWSYLLASDPEHRERIWSTLEKAHRFSLQIVYGSHPELTKQLGSLYIFNETLAELARAVLRVFLISPRSQTDILKRLDICISRGSTYLRKE